MDRRTLLLFDFDGVIIDSVSLMERYVMKHWGDSKEQLRLTVEGNSHAKKDGSLPAPEDLAADAVSVAFYQDYGDGMTDCIVYDGMRQVLETLAEQHVLYVVSSTPTPLIARYLDHCGLAACFAGIYGVEVTPDKTKKIGMIVACEQIALRDCLMITDTLGIFTRPAVRALRRLASHGDCTTGGRWRGEARGVSARSRPNYQRQLRDISESFSGTAYMCCTLTLLY